MPSAAPERPSETEKAQYTPADTDADVIPRFKRSPLESTPKRRPKAAPDMPNIPHLDNLELDRLLVGVILLLFIAENGLDMAEDIPLILGLLAIL